MAEVSTSKTPAIEVSTSNTPTEPKKKVKPDKFATENKKGVSIQTLFVHRIPKKASRADIHRIFAEYGPLNCSKFYECDTNTSYAFVTYTNVYNAQKARKAASRKEIKLEGQPLKVSVAHRQPSNSKPKQSDQDSQTKKTKPKKPTIQYDYINTLDDDCLRKIFYELSMADRMLIERVCKRWQGVSQDVWSDIKKMKLTHSQLSTIKFPNNFKHDPIYDLSIESVGKILSRCGRFLRNLTIVSRNSEQNILPLVVEHCYNATKLSIDWGLIGASWLQNLKKDLFLNFKALKSVRMINCQQEHITRCILTLPTASICEIDLSSHTSVLNLTLRPQSFAWNSIKALSNFNNLHTLNLKSFFLEKKKLPSLCRQLKLKNISLVNCTLESVDTTITSLLKNIERLELRKIMEVNDALICSIAENCKQLKYLDISYCTGVGNSAISALSKLPQLESLLVRGLLISDKALQSMSSLKSLNCGSCSTVFDKGIIELIENSPRLEYLNVTNTRITKATLQEATRIIRRRTNNVILKIVVEMSLLDFVDQEPVPLLVLEGHDSRFQDDSSCADSDDPSVNFSDSFYDFGDDDDDDDDDFDYDMYDDDDDSEDLGDLNLELFGYYGLPGCGVFFD